MTPSQTPPVTAEGASAAHAATTVKMTRVYTAAGFGDFPEDVQELYAEDVYTGDPFEVRVPLGTTEIEDYTFSRLDGMVAVELPPSVTHIGHGAFAECRDLTRISFSRGLRSIGEHAFAGCSSLTVVNLPEGLVRIELQAFQKCTALVAVSVPSTVQRALRTRTGPVRGPHGIFGGCTNLALAIVPPHVLISPYYAVGYAPEGLPSMSEALVENSLPTRRRFWRFLNWTRQTHSTNPRRCRDWVCHLLLVAARLQLGHLPSLPPEMWLLVLGFVPRLQLGPN